MRCCVGAAWPAQRLGREQDQCRNLRDGWRREAASLGARSGFSDCWRGMKFRRCGSCKRCRRRILRLSPNNWRRRPRTRIAFRQACGSMFRAFCRSKLNRIRAINRRDAGSVTGRTTLPVGGLRRKWSFRPLPLIHGLSPAGKSERRCIAPIQPILSVRRGCVAGYRRLPSVRFHQVVFWNGWRCHCHIRAQHVAAVGYEGDRGLRKWSWSLRYLALHFSSGLAQVVAPATFSCYSGMI